MRRNMRYQRQNPVHQKQQNNQSNHQQSNKQNKQTSNQNKQCKNVSCQQSCSAGLAYVGNIFLLGLATVLTELINLQAAAALETLLDPFIGDSGTALEQEILAAGLEDSITDVDLLDVIE